MSTQNEIELTVLQICNSMGLDAKLPSEANVKDSWREFIHSKDGKHSVASTVWHDKDVRNQVVDKVREFYKERRRKEQGRI
jgi:alpha-D-ribose 1-methylphosphonate 5-triphosphate synthase subunit PhnL